MNVSLAKLSFLDVFFPDLIKKAFFSLLFNAAYLAFRDTAKDAWPDGMSNASWSNFINNAGFTADTANDAYTVAKDAVYTCNEIKTTVADATTYNNIIKNLTNGVSYIFFGIQKATGLLNKDINKEEITDTINKNISQNNIAPTIKIKEIKVQELSETNINH